MAIVEEGKYGFVIVAYSNRLCDPDQGLLTKRVYEKKELGAEGGREREGHTPYSYKRCQFSSPRSTIGRHTLCNSW